MNNDIILKNDTSNINYATISNYKVVKFEDFIRLMVLYVRYCCGGKLDNTYDDLTKELTKYHKDISIFANGGVEKLLKKLFDNFILKHNLSARVYFNSDN